MNDTDCEGYFFDGKEENSKEAFQPEISLPLRKQNSNLICYYFPHIDKSNTLCYISYEHLFICFNLKSFREGFAKQNM